MEHRKHEHYPENFKLKIVREVLTGQLSKLEAKRKYSLGGNSDVSKWLTYYEKYGVCTLSLVRKEQLLVTHKQTENKPEEQLKLEAWIKVLEQKLQEESLLKEMYSRMIDIAETEYKIPIRKKLDTK